MEIPTSAHVKIRHEIRNITQNIPNITLTSNKGNQIAAKRLDTIFMNNLPASRVQRQQNGDGEMCHYDPPIVAQCEQLSNQNDALFNMAVVYISQWLPF